MDLIQSLTFSSPWPIIATVHTLGKDHLIFRGGGGWDFLEKNSLFPYRSEKNKMSSTKLKIKSLFFIQRIFFEALRAIKVCK